MNSRQRRARIRADMPGVVHHILTMKLMGDISAYVADYCLEMLRADNLSLCTLERIARVTAESNRQAERRAALKGYISVISGKTVHTVIHDEITRSNDQSLRSPNQVSQTRPLV